MVHKGKLSLLESLESPEEDNKDKNVTGVEYIDGIGGGENNTDSGGASVEWLKFLRLRVQPEALGAMKKAKAYSSTALRKNRRWEKLRIKKHGRETLPVIL